MSRYIGVLRKMQSCFFILLGLCMFFIIIYNLEIRKPIVVYQTFYKVVKPENGLYCHLLNVLDTMPDITDADIKPDQSIFFLETSCNSYLKGQIFIKARQACAVESAALMNPNRAIYLLYASPGKFYDDKTESSRLINNLMSYPNIKIVYFNLKEFIKGTPVEKLWSTGQVQKSKYQIEHTSDLLRLVALWKYGGIYLDLDVIVTKSIETIPLNFAGAESQQDVCNSVLSFSREGVGHRHVTTILNDIRDHYDGNQWSFNGPKAILRMLVPICNTTDTSKMINTTCQGFQILPESVFLSIHWSEWQLFFNETKIDHVKQRTDDSYMIHVWNKLSYVSKIPLYKNVPYLDLARTYCPGTVSSLEDYF